MKGIRQQKWSKNRGTRQKEKQDPPSSPMIVIFDSHLGLADCDFVAAAGASKRRVMPLLQLRAQHTQRTAHVGGGLDARYPVRFLNDADSERAVGGLSLRALAGALSVTCSCSP